MTRRARSWFVTVVALAPLAFAAAATAAPEAPGAAPELLAAPTEGQKAVEAHFAPVVGRCERGDAAACARLAHRLMYRTDEREMLRLAVTMWTACAAKMPVACAGQALAMLTAPKRVGEAKPALDLLRKACADKEGFACALLADVYLRGDAGVTGKEEEGRRLARQSCDKLGGWPCWTAATIMGDLGKPATSALANRACDAGDAPACYELGQLYAEGGGGVAADPARATSLYKKGCDGDLAQSCFNLAWQHLRGTGAAKDERRGRELLQHACKLGDASGCDELARRDGKARDYCELWGAEACFTVAAELSQKHGETAAVADAILSASIRACKRGHRGACNGLGHLASDTVKQCDAGQQVQDSCTFAGLIHARGLSLPRMAGASVDVDAKRAGRELGRACAAGAQPACRAMKATAP